MRRQSPAVANPFVMLTDPETILNAVERSERLNTLQRRVCRPLDRPLIPKTGAKDLSAFDQEIDGDDVEPEIDAEADIVIEAGAL